MHNERQAVELDAPRALIDYRPGFQEASLRHDDGDD